MGYDSEGTPPHFKPDLDVDEKTEMITFKLSAEKDQVDVVGTVRTSGTEPKVNFQSSGTVAGWLID